MRKNYIISEGKILETVEPSGVISVFINPDNGERNYLVNELKIDEHTLSSALDPDEPSRMEFEPEHLALIFKRPRNYSGEDQLLFKVASIGAFLFKDRLMIVMTEDLPLFEGKQFARVNSLNEVALRLIYRSITHFLEHLKVINMLADEIEQKISHAMENRLLLNMFTLEKSLVYYVNAINSNGAVLEKLKINAGKIGFSAFELELLDDITIENNQCLRQADIYANILANLMDARVSIVSNNLNIIMKTLTIITLLIMVPTFVVSLFSMNVRIPLAPLSNAFWIIFGMCILAVAIVIIIWKYKKW